MAMWPEPNYSIQEWADLRNAMAAYAKALDRAVFPEKGKKDKDGYPDMYTNNDKIIKE